MRHQGAGQILEQAVGVDLELAQDNRDLYLVAAGMERQQPKIDEGVADPVVGAADVTQRTGDLVSQRDAAAPN